MPDEERIEQLELEVKVLQANNKGLKDKIDEQSKEIEELKNADLTTVYLNGVYDGEKKVEDKIKAKIEELNDGIKRDMINNDKLKDESWKLAIHRSMAQIIEIKKVLQSLLDKE